MNDLERQISKRVHAFDIISLIRLLVSMGYSQDEIRFKSHNSLCSQPGLIHDITFRQKPLREVAIELNMGLLNAQSPLPSYFRRKIEDDVAGRRRFEDFMGFLDHHLIKDYIHNIYPEINRSYFPCWELTKRRYIELLDLKSCTALHWLFQIVFPEIGVNVEKISLDREIRIIPIQLGNSALGNDAVFGRKAQVLVHGRRITLYSEDDVTDTQVPWPREIKNRLNGLIFPVLQPTGIDLEVNLVLKSQKRWAKLHQEAYLGYDRIRNGTESYRRINVFKGHIEDAIPPAEEAEAGQ